VRPDLSAPGTYAMPTACICTRVQQRDGLVCLRAFLAPQKETGRAVLLFRIATRRAAYSQSMQASKEFDPPLSGSSQLRALASNNLIHCTRIHRIAIKNWFEFQFGCLPLAPSVSSLPVRTFATTRLPIRLDQVSIPFFPVNYH